MQKMVQGKWLELVKPLVVLVGMVVLGLVSVNVFAVGHDILAGTDTDLMATVQGSGRKYLYLAEGITSIAAYMKTRNFFVLGGILVVALAFNMLLKVYSGA